MTLILSCITHSFALQVSDRRLTIGAGPRAGQVYDDRTNKAVMFRNRMSFGYTGLGLLGSKKTDVWLANVLADPNVQTLSNACNKLRDAATERFRQIQDPRIPKHHAFVGVGWTISEANQHYRPIICSISNALRADGHWAERPSQDFKLEHSILGPNELLRFRSAGQPLPAGMRDEVVRFLRRSVEKGDNPRAMIRILVTALRSVAERNTLVGKSVLSVCIPKTAVERSTAESFLLSGAPTDWASTFLYFPEDGEDPVQYAPSLVFDGGYARDLTIKPLSPSQVVPPPPPPRNVVLTAWIGSGRNSDSQRPAVGDQFQLTSWGDITGAESWPVEAPCPYVGCLVAVDAPREVLDSIREDPGYMIVFSDAEPPDSAPSPEWIASLAQWLQSHGMSLLATQEVESRIAGLIRREILKVLLDVVRKPMSDMRMR